MQEALNSIMSLLIVTDILGRGLTRQYQHISVMAEIHKSHGQFQADLLMMLAVSNSFILHCNINLHKNNLKRYWLHNYCPVYFYKIYRDVTGVGIMIEQNSA